MPRHLFLLWIAALVYLFAANAQSSVRLDVIPAWNGHFKPGKPTELGLQLISDRSGTFTVQTETLSTTVDLKANLPQTVSMPVATDRRKNTQIVRAFQQADPGVSATRSLSLIASARIIVALVANHLTLEERKAISQALENDEMSELLAVDSVSLPQSANGYAAIDLLIVSYADLKTLQDRQVDALSAYLTLCGKLIAVQFPEAVYRQLKATAGCQGEFLSAAPSVGDISQLMPALLHRSPLPLPNAKTLSSFSPPASLFNPRSLPLIFCFGYLLLLLMAAFVNQSKRLFMLLPILAAGVPLSLWYRQAPESHLQSWLEMDSGQTAARYSASLTMNGTGKWHEAVTLPIETMFSSSAATAPAEVADHGVMDTVYVRPEFSLLSSTDWHWQGHLNIEAPLKLKTDGQKVALTNTSGQIAESGFLRWQGNIYSFPPLASGESWTPDLAKPASYTELLQLFARQSQYSAAAVLVPYRAKVLPFGSDHQGWLLIHYPKATI